MSPGNLASNPRLLKEADAFQRLLLAAVANAFEGASAGPSWRH